MSDNVQQSKVKEGSEEFHNSLNDINEQQQHIQSSHQNAYKNSKSCDQRKTKKR